jgi:hypothetical protein
VQGLGETQSPLDVPQSPSLAPRHGRRASQGKFMYPIITEQDDESASGPPSPAAQHGAQAPAIRSAQLSPNRARRAKPKLSIGTGIGVSIDPFGPPRPLSPSALHTHGPGNGSVSTGAAFDKSPPLSTPNSLGLGLSSLLQVRAGVDSGCDPAVNSPPYRTGGGAQESMVSPGSMSGATAHLLLRRSSVAHRYQADEDDDADLPPHGTSHPGALQHVPHGLAAIVTHASAGRRAGGGGPTHSNPCTPTRAGESAPLLCDCLVSPSALVTGK